MPYIAANKVRKLLLGIVLLAALLSAFIYSSPHAAGSTSDLTFSSIETISSGLTTSAGAAQAINNNGQVMDATGFVWTVSSTPYSGVWGAVEQ